MRNIGLALILTLIVAAPAGAHDDVVPYASGGKILTGGHDDAEGTNTVEQRVFGYDFGEDPLDPYFIGDPGFNNGAFAIGIFPNDGLLPAGFTLAFDVITNLEYWDGTGAVAFAAAPAGIELGLQRGSNTVNISGTGTSGTVPTIGSTGASGRLHVHLGSLLNAADGIDPSPPNAPDGIYFVGLTLKLPGSGLEDSDPIYLVYNNGLDEEVHDLALEWVEANLVPEPATWAMMVSGSVALIGVAVRRRRQRGSIQRG